MQNSQKSIRTNAELTKLYSDKCRTYKIIFRQMQNLQNFIRTNAELTKVHSDKCRTYKILFGQMQNLQKSIRTNDNSTIRTKAASPLNALKNLPIVLFNPFYYIYALFYTKLPTFQSKPCIPFSFPSRRPCDEFSIELSMRRIFRRRIFLRRIFRIP